MLTLIALTAFGAFLIIQGFRGLLVEDLPAQYLGYLIIAVVVLGLMGVNVWRGGPFDPRRDAPGDGIFRDQNPDRYPFHKGSASNQLEESTPSKDPVPPHRYRVVRSVKVPE